MLDDTLNEVRKLGYEVMWIYDEELDEIRVRIKKDRLSYTTAIQRGRDRKETELMIDVAIRLLVERMEKEDEDES